MEDEVEMVVGMGEEDRICESGDGVGIPTAAAGDNDVKVDGGPKGGGGGDDDDDDDDDDVDDFDTAGAVDGRGSAKKMSSSRSWSCHRCRTRFQV